MMSAPTNTGCRWLSFVEDNGSSALMENACTSKNCSLNRLNFNSFEKNGDAVLPADNFIKPLDNPHHLLGRERSDFAPDPFD